MKSLSLAKTYLIMLLYILLPVFILCAVLDLTADLTANSGDKKTGGEG